MAVVFQNRGLIDLDAIRVRGVSVKETDTAIGKFGTGFGYALSVLLREGCSVELWRGGDRHVFSTRPRTIRGKEFHVVEMDGESLGFTTHLGHAWQVWQAYRELWCNAHDEPDARVFRADDETSAGMSFLNTLGEQDGEEDLTRVIVSGPAIESAHRNRHEIVLQTEPMYVLPGVEVHAGPSDHIFYQGIRVYKLPKPAKFTYNLTSPQALTEDRTLAWGYDVVHKIGRALVQATQRPLIETILESSGEVVEGSIPYSLIKETMPSPQFLEIASELRDQRRLNGSSTGLFVSYADSLDRYGMNDPRVVEPTIAEQALVNSVRDDLHDRGFGTLGVHIVFRTHTDRVSTRDGILSLPATLLSGERQNLADAIVSGVAQIQGGSLVRQLCRYVSTGEWLGEAEVRSSRESDEELF